MVICRDIRDDHRVLCLDDLMVMFRIGQWPLGGQIIHGIWTTIGKQGQIIAIFPEKNSHTSG